VTTSPARRALALGAAILVLFAVAARAAPAPRLLEVRDLNGRNFVIPRGLPAERTLLLLAFRHADRSALDGWREGLRLSSQDSAWLEMPIISVRSSLIQRMILDGMRKGANTPEARAHLAPAFTDGKTISAEFGVAPGRPAVVVIDRAGRVLARASGDYNPVEARTLAAAWR
jgi:hypothetical protein